MKKIIKSIRRFFRRTFYNLQRKIYLEKQLKIAWNRIDELEDRINELEDFQKRIREYFPRIIRFE